ncbi:MAG: hypothetical protein IIZ38_11350 [Sphingomonas sp.]|uniref:hypothetical protein n=1 Tax=unclassified Sphingomonas TaxID=196159 RepID=UPI002454788E|nr:MULTISPECIES: hypothetical protein [unclassified Sphingomonas]MBQ1498900.1 hypothetical protein [Sphingomonas sp.]MDH4746041.1 hypothetical protein [Sphingomonas sp. CBMAI 2297]
MRLVVAAAILATATGWVPQVRAQIPATIPDRPQSGATYDPYGRWELRAPEDRPVETTRLLRVEDGTPFYEKGDYDSPAVESRLLPIIKGSNLPAGAGPKSPYLPGTNLRFAYHYLIDFWRAWPQAKVRGAAGESRTAAGAVAQRLSRAAVFADPGLPKAAVDTLFAQADALYQAVLKMPALQRAQGMALRGSVWMTRRKDIAGVEVYSFRLVIGAPALHLATPGAKQGSDGRWHVPEQGHNAGIAITSNIPLRGGPAWGRYHGTQVAFLPDFAALVVAGDRPTHVSEFRGGGGKQVENPRFFDPARPKTDIQILTVEPGASSPIEARLAHQGSLSPDTIYGRLIAASFLPDWRPLVDRLNSPGAPRAQ